MGELLFLSQRNMNVKLVHFQKAASTEVELEQNGSFLMEAKTWK